MASFCAAVTGPHGQAQVIKLLWSSKQRNKQRFATDRMRTSFECGRESQADSIGLVKHVKSMPGMF